MAGKKSHGPRGPASKKQTSSVPESDHIVFTKNPTESSKKGKEKEEASTAPRPDTRKVIGGASWTGKLPVNLLSEIAQRQKWNRPEYSMRRLPQASGGGYVSSVTLSQKHPKTQETTKLQPFHLPPSHLHLASQETALEARHFAAAYALFRVSSMKNIHLTLPPKYRDLWKGDFAQLKEEDLKANRGWMYDADPFATALETKKIRDAMETRKAKADVEKAASAASIKLHGHDRTKPLPKVWERAPKIELGTKVRSDVEDLIRTRGDWNLYGIEMSDQQREAIVTDLTQRGFRRVHVQEAVRECRDGEETLHWLLIHVPEDDLPAWSFPENYTSGVVLASGNLVLDAKVRRLALSGNSTTECALALRKSGGDETLAAQELQDNLVVNSVAAADVPESSMGAWQEEMETLRAIYGDRFTSSSPEEFLVTGELENIQLHFYFRRPGGDYPQTSLPILALHSKDLPAYIRLSATQGALRHAAETLMGMPMVFNLVEWLESNLPSIIDNPGDLRALRQPAEARTTPTLSDGQPPSSRPRKPARFQHQKNRGQNGAVWRPPCREMTAAQETMLNARKSLPAWSMKEEIVRVVSEFQCVIISGETGSGKSTQSMQFILDHLRDSHEGGDVANMVCTQPRRISALGLADRVSDERCGTVGDEVGYIIRGNSKISSQTRITFMTTGVLLRRLQTAKDVNMALDELTHVFVDEVHERGVDTDFLLALLREAMKVRPSLKVVLMSATLEADIFMSYFGGPDKVGQVHIPGRTFPVTDYFIDDIVQRIGYNGSVSRSEDFEGDMSADSSTMGSTIRSLGAGINYKLIADLVSSIDHDLGNRPGGILIFLPGTMEIDRCLNALRSCRRVFALPLHASLTPAEQKRVFPLAPSGMRKVIAATNVAETSITIADIVVVIDSGRVKETSYDPTDNTVRLQEIWASRAACRQRQGRAGRTQAGSCYKLFTRKLESEMAAHPLPEIQRLPLEQLCLSVKATISDQEVTQFLQQTITPPNSQAMTVAINLLHRIGALDNNELTALGRHLSMIPTDLRCAKLLVYGSIFNCLEACLTISAILTVRSPFVSPRDKRDLANAARASFSTEHGDLVLALDAYNQWNERSQTQPHRATLAWCAEKFLSPQTLRDIASTRAQLHSSLIEAGVTSPASSSSSSSSSQPPHPSLLRALIASALYPQILRIALPDQKYTPSLAGAVQIDPEAREIKYFDQDGARAFVHPSSTLFDARGFSGGGAYVAYFNKVQTSRVFVRDVTPFNAYSLLLFGGPLTLSPDGQGVMVDGWLRLKGWARIGVLVARLRTLLDRVLQRRIEQPGGLEGEDERVVDVVRRLVLFDGQDQ